MSTTGPFLQFGNAHIDLGQRRLLIDGQPAKLGARAFDVLQALVERRDRVVSKNELFDLVWPDVVVEENNLQVHVSALRKLLGPQAIATIPGRGYRFIATGEGEEGSPLTTPAVGSGFAMAPAVPSNLPAQHGTLFGRDVDLVAVRELLRARRLVSIVGAGGVGKTRLALAVAAAERERFTDGAWWIELATLNHDEQVARAIAHALGLRVGDERPARDSVAAFLQNQTALLVVDNCEHLRDAVAEALSAIISRAPALKVLVTSQEALHVPDEQIYRLGGLDVDGRGDAATGGAVALFVARAQASDPGLRLDSGALARAADICRRLDGIPLAIELAAARVRLLGIDGTHARLDERFRLLTGGTRATLRRHQTLRAALDWSHKLLSQNAQTVFRRVGVFVGGFTMELAQAVAADERIDRWAVLDILGDLVDKSLVVADGDDSPRYRLLETMRAFALEKLAEAGEGPELLHRHAAALLDHLQAVHEQRYRLSPEARVRAGAELDNLRAALAWAASPAGDRGLGCALIGASLETWWVHELRQEGIEGALSFMPLPEGLTPQVEAAFCLQLAALGSLGAREECFRASLRAIALYRELADTEALVDALCWSAMIGCWRGETAHAEAAVSDAEQLVHPQTSARQRAVVAVARALAYAYEDRNDEARACELRQAAVYRACGNAWGEQLALGNAALYECAMGEFDAALERLQGVVDAFQRMDTPYGAGHALVLLAAAHALRGDRDEALARAQEALPHSQRLGLTTWLLLSLGVAHACHGDPARAAMLAGYFDAAYARVGRVPSPLEEKARSRIRESALGAMGPTDFARLLELGANLDEERAVASALVLKSADSVLSAWKYN